MNFVSVVESKDKTMADKFMYLPNDDTKITPFVDPN